MKITRHTVPNFLNFISSLLMLFFVHIWKFCYKLPSVVYNLYIRTDFWSKFCLLNWTASCWQAVWRVIFKICVIFGVWFERRKVSKEQTYTKTEACKVYLRVFWIFMPNVIKIEPYNFEIYRFKVCAFFETQCIIAITLSPANQLCIMGTDRQ